MKTTIHRIAVLVALTTLAVALVPVTAPAARAEEAERQPSARPTLQDLRGVEELSTMFNRDAGTVRLVLLVSPT